MDTLASEIFTERLTTASNFKQHNKCSSNHMLHTTKCVQFVIVKKQVSKVPSNHLSELKLEKAWKQHKHAFFHIRNRFLFSTLAYFFNWTKLPWPNKVGSVLPIEATNFAGWGNSHNFFHAFYWLGKVCNKKHELLVFHW